MTYDMFKNKAREMKAMLPADAYLEIRVKVSNAEFNKFEKEFFEGRHRVLVTTGEDRNMKIWVSLDETIPYRNYLFHIESYEIESYQAETIEDVQASLLLDVKEYHPEGKVVYMFPSGNPAA